MDEYTAFGRWLIRKAPKIRYSYGGLGQGFWGWTDSDLDDEIDDSDSDDFFD